jgi:hypothetical protein
MFERLQIGVCDGPTPLLIAMLSDCRWTGASSSTFSLYYLEGWARLTIRFFMFVVHNKRGDIGLEAATFGEAQYIAICLGMHREDVSCGRSQGLSIS